MVTTPSTGRRLRTTRQPTAVSVSALSITATATFARWNGADWRQTTKIGAITFASTYAFASIGNSGLSYGNKAVASGLVGGLTAEASGGRFRQGFASSAFSSYAGSASGYYFNRSPVAVRVTVSAVVGGTASRLAGGKFANGASTAAFLYLFSEAPRIYKKAVGYELDGGPGGAAVGKDPVSGPPVKGANNIGTQDININPNSIFGEGGKVSRFANQIPGINAVAGLHDDFQISMGDSILRDVLNVPGMAIAAGVTYSGFVGQLLNNAPNYLYIPLNVSDDKKKPRYIYLPAGGY